MEIRPTARLRVSWLSKMISPPPQMCSQSEFKLSHRHPKICTKAVMISRDLDQTMKFTLLLTSPEKLGEPRTQKIQYV